MKRFIGIDFGTRYTYIYGGYIDDDARAFHFIDLIDVLLKESQLKYAVIPGKGLPTVIGKIRGTHEPQWLLGKVAIDQKRDNPNIDLEFGLKTAFRDGIYDCNEKKRKSNNIGDETYYDLAVAFFREIIDAIKSSRSGRAFINDGELEHVYIGHPDDIGLTYGGAVRKAVNDAFRLCGCNIQNKIDTMPEARLAGYAYCLARGMDDLPEQYIGVIDCGGGTTDFTILHWIPETNELENKATSHDNTTKSQHPAGDTFDEKLLDAINKYCTDNGVRPNLSEEYLRVRVREIKEGFYPPDYTEEACIHAESRHAVQRKIQTNTGAYIPIVFNRDAESPMGAIEFNSDSVKEDQQLIAERAASFFESNLKRDIFPPNTMLGKLLFVGGTSLMWELRDCVVNKLIQVNVFSRDGKLDENIWFIKDESSGPSVNNDKPRVGNAVALGGCYLAKSLFNQQPIDHGGQNVRPTIILPKESTEYLAICPCDRLSQQGNRVLFRSGDIKTCNAVTHETPYLIPNNGKFTFRLVRTNNGTTKNTHYTFTGQAGEQVYFIAVFNEEEKCYDVYGMTKTELQQQYTVDTHEISLVDRVRVGDRSYKRHWQPT